MRTQPEPVRGLKSGLEIVVTSGVGEGPTQLAAFDAALEAAGVGQFNIVQLSSVLPSGSRIAVSDVPASPWGGWGDLLYAVYAERRAQRPGEQACAGLGWIQDEASGEGLFVEHDGASHDEVEKAIRASLGDMAGRRGRPFGPVQLKIASTTCRELPVCVVVVATFGTAAWGHLVASSNGLPPFRAGTGRSG